jgi:DNA-binding response OmpR family regulator
MSDTAERASNNAIPPIVLVVEDDASTRDMYEALLNAAGFWVMKAADAAEGFAYAKDFHPDAVLTDLGLPGECDGAGLIRALRGDPDFHSTPIIAITGRQPRELPSLRGLQISAVLLKPISPGMLTERLRAAIQASDALRARNRRLQENIPAILRAGPGAARNGPAPGAKGD